MGFASRKMNHIRLVLRMSIFSRGLELARPCAGLLGEMDWVCSHRSSDSCTNRVSELSMAATL